MRVGEVVGEDGKVDVEFDLPAELAARVDTFCVAHNMPSDEFFEKAMLNLMHSIDRDKYILRLLELQAKYSRRIEQIIHAGIDFNELVIDENLLALVLDMIGVPADTMCEYPEVDSESSDYPPEGLFCREWFSDEFDRVVRDGTLLQCLEYIRTVRAWVDDWNSGKFKRAI